MKKQKKGFKLALTASSALLATACVVMAVLRIINSSSLGDTENILAFLQNENDNYLSKDNFVHIAGAVCGILLGITTLLLVAHIIYRLATKQKFYKPLYMFIPTIVCAVSCAASSIAASASSSAFDNTKSYWAFECNMGYLAGSTILLEPDGDEDGDGLTNDEEINTYKTDPYSQDSDSDALRDPDELIYGTNPLKEDSDGDGLLDGVEVAKSLDPLSESTDSKTLDKLVTFPGSYNTSNYTADIALSWDAGDANMSLSYLENVTDNYLVSNPYILTDAYLVHSKGTNSGMTISFDVNGNTDDCVIYAYDNGNLTPVKSTKDDNGNISATVADNKTYVVGKKNIKSSYPTVISFVIDNSGSMYDQFVSSLGRVGNDNSGKRFEMVNGIAKALGTNNYTYNLYTFIGSVTTELRDVTDLSVLNEKLSNTNEPQSSSDLTGTNIGGGVKAAINDMVSYDGYRKIIIVLTDGEDTTYNDLNSIAYEAKENKIALIGIGLGDEVEPELPEMITAGSGDIFYAKDANCLEDVVAKIKASIELTVKNDRILIADCGFTPEKNGFQFKNYSTEQSGGHCFGMATFAKLYYMGELEETFDGDDSGTLNVNSMYSPSYILTNSTVWSNYKNGVDLYSWDSAYGIAFPGKSLAYDWNNITDGFVPFTDEMREYIESKNGTVITMPSSGTVDEVTTCEYYEVDPLNLSDNEYLSSFGAAPKNKAGDDFEKALSLYRASEEYNAADSGDWETHLALYSMQTWQHNKDAHGVQLNTYENVEALEARVNTGEPVVLVINGDHAVNLCKIEQDVNDSTKYYYSIYDNNYPGVTKTLCVTITPYSYTNLSHLGSIIFGNDCSTSFTYDIDGDGTTDQSGSLTYYVE